MRGGASVEEHSSQPRILDGRAGPEIGGEEGDRAFEVPVFKNKVQHWLPVGTSVTVMLNHASCRVLASLAVG